MACSSSVRIRPTLSNSMGLLSRQLTLLARSASWRFAHAGVTRRNAKALVTFDTTLQREGLQAGLEILNGIGQLRFSGLYRFDPPFLRSLYLVDKRHPGILSSGPSQVLEDTYAAIIQKWKQPFFTDDSAADSRLARHPARHTVRAYAGAPVKAAGGRLWGVLAYHDHEPRPIAPGQMEFLIAAAGFVGRWLADRELGRADGIPQA